MEEKGMEKQKQRVSVRNLVEFILRSGDIDNRRGKSAEREAMQEGSRIHRKIQRRMGSDYLAEVPLKYEIENPYYILSVEGRADGVFRKDQDTAIDEIKGVYRDLAQIEEPVPVHLAQAKCYGYLYAVSHDLSRIGVQMTYCNLDTEEIKRFFFMYEKEELQEWFEDLIRQYQKWADFRYEWNQIRTSSIKQLEFPFPYRDGQKQLVTDVYRTLLRKKILFLQAPTGSGKTLATVFPAVKAVGEGLGDKIFYLTAKTITRTVAKEAFGLLADHGYRGKVLEITAKEKMCFCEEMDCNPDHCPYAKGHYDRVNDAVFDLLHKENVFERDGLLDHAQTYQVCPFEMSLDLALWSDVIICDYNYVFDPNICLKRFFGEDTKGDYYFLVDEAHNLVDRGREMYSASLVKEEFLKQKKLMKQFGPGAKDGGGTRHYKEKQTLAERGKIIRELEKCNKQMLEWKRECEDYCLYDNTGAFVFSLMRLGAAYDKFLQGAGDFPERKEISDFYLNLRHFLNIYERVDENYVIYTFFNEAGEFVLKLYCVNPGVNLQECLDRGLGTVYFSATLLPIRYYKKLLSSRDDNYAVYARTAFSQDQRLLVIAKDVSSLYTRRNPAEFARIASYIYETCMAKKGNYLIFFPSYKMMEQVYEAFLDAAGGHVDCLIQEPGMREADREEFIGQFAKERKVSLAAFCVLGGIFSEGIDLKEEQLIGAVIIGTGLPQICTEREILKSYYQEKDDQGFSFAYQYPGMNKVLQAAGRVIRTVQDRGVIVLLDERFLRKDYREMFPREWERFETCTLETFPEKLKGFWKEPTERAEDPETPW